MLSGLITLTYAEIKQEFESTIIEKTKQCFDDGHYIVNYFIKHSWEEETRLINDLTYLKKKSMFLKEQLVGSEEKDI